MTHFFVRALCVLICCSFLVGCPFPVSDSDGVSLLGRPELTFDSVRDKDPHARLGAREHPRIIASYGGVYESEELERLLAPIVGRLVTHSDSTDEAFSITILDSPVVNAFALPGGYLYVTRGLLALANDESEIAAVLAHEMAHVSSNHGIERRRQARTATIVERVVDEVVTNPLAGKIAQASAAQRLTVFSQTQELQADAVGIQTLGKSGYDPYAPVRFLESMERFAKWRSSDGLEQDRMSSHPSAPERINLARRHAREVSDTGEFERGRERFLNHIDGIRFGDREQDGYIRNKQFWHSMLGITFAVPDDFELSNRSDSVIAASSNEVAMRFDVVPVSGFGDASDYIRSGWVNGLIESSVTPRTFDSLDAATARSLAGGWQFAIAVIRRERLYLRFILASPDDEFGIIDRLASVLSTFRTLTPDEVSNLNPLRISVRRVESGDTISGFVSEMADVSRKERLFLALNGLDRGSVLRPGELVKLVVE